jgi:hypothetical protein
MKRYIVHAEEHCVEIEAPDGDWVRFEDAERELARLREYIEVLESSNRALVDGREEWARRCREMAKNQ